VLVAPELETRLKSWKIPTDDWPFLYLREPGIPSHYLVVLGAILLITLLLLWILVGRGRGPSVLRNFDWPLFLLGAGFLSLETKSVTSMSLLFGSTWTTNVLVFSSILAVLLLANICILRLQGRGSKIGHRWLFVPLLLSLVALAGLPVSSLSGLAPHWKWLSAACVVGLPIGIAGLLFPTLLAGCSDVRAAMGANLLGAIVGGACEYITMWKGLASLNYLAMLFYLLAWGIVERRSSS
jgi:hypothetical protein